MSENLHKDTKIFLAEDDEDDRLLFYEALNEINSNIPLIESYDGVHLLQNLKQHEVKQKDILFLDLNMPLMNGFECLDKIKNDKDFDEFRIVIFSTTAENDYVEKSFQKGAFLYIRKPESFQVLIKTIQTILNLNLDSRPKRDEFLFQLIERHISQRNT